MTKTKLILFLLPVLIAVGAGVVVISENYHGDDSVHADLISQAKLTPAERTDKKVVYLEVGLTEAEKEIWYRAPEGGDIVPVAYLKALINHRTGTPFIESLPRYGFIPDPRNPDGLPIGFTANVPADSILKLPYVGINCAACHTGLIEYNEIHMIIDGAPNLSEFEAFVIDLTAASKQMLEDPVKSFSFMRRFLVEVEKSKAEGAPVRTQVATLKFMQCLDHDHNHGSEKDDDNIPDEVEGQIVKLFGTTFSKTIKSKQSKMDFPKADFEKLLKKIDHPEKESWLEHLGHSFEAIGPNLEWLIDRTDLTTRLHWAFDNQVYAGPGRGDSFGAVRNVVMPRSERIALTSPASFSDLFDLKERQWVHWDASTRSVMGRNIAQAVAFGATLNTKTLETSVLPFQIHALEEVAQKIKPPRWPEEILGKLDRQKIERGRKIFAAKCVGCHSYNSQTPESQERLFSPEEIGTDPNRARSYAVRLKDETFADGLTRITDRLEKKMFEQHNIGPAKAKELTFGRDTEWRTTGKYVARQLKAVWATAPFLHNGSVPDLWSLLQPVSKRPAKWKSGSHHFDPNRVGYRYDENHDYWIFDTTQSGNHNTGHEGDRFGTNMSDEDKWDLIEYLKTI